MARRVLHDGRAIVTGASGGIGRALAIALAQQGSRLVLCARRADKLEETAAAIRGLGGRVALVCGDITEASVRLALVEKAKAEFGGLDLLVNNAGAGAIGRFEDADSQRLRRIMEVNFFAMAEMTRAALPVLKHGTTPMVVNISSILGHRGIPRMTEYCASKFAVQGFSEALRAELHQVGIDLLVVSPGTTASEFQSSLIDKSGEVPWPQHPGVPPEVVAARIAHAIRKGKHAIVPNFRGQLLVWLNRLSPRIVDSLMTRWG